MPPGWSAGFGSGFLSWLSWFMFFVQRVFCPMHEHGTSFDASAASSLRLAQSETLLDVFSPLSSCAVAPISKALPVSKNKTQVMRVMSLMTAALRPENRVLLHVSDCIIRGLGYFFRFR